MTTRRRPGTTDPHRSRERALKVLFQADVRRIAPSDMLSQVLRSDAASALLDDEDDAVDEESIGARVEEARERGRHPIDGYARALVAGVSEHQAEIDELIEGYAERWTLDRMPTVDRNVLRLAAYELLHEDTPPAVVIDEALTFARELSTDRSGGFINGVLESIRNHEGTKA